MASFASKRLFAPLAAVAAFAASSLLPAEAGLVAKWDFDNYDPENPTSAAILAPTVGNLAAVPYTGTSSSTEVTDGTLGAITVLAPSATGLPEGDYALAIPKGAHLWMPLPSGIVNDKCWTIRIRFNIPTSSDTVLNALISGKLDTVGNEVWFTSNVNLIQGKESLFGTTGEENRNSTGKLGKNSKQNNGTVAFRQITHGTWHAFAMHFGPNATSSTLDGYRSVSMSEFTDVRAKFTGDGFVLCGGNNTVTTYIASVEVWEDTPIYRDVNGSAYIQRSSRKIFEGHSLEDIRDMYISVKGLGTWGDYARTMSSWEHVVTTNAEGEVTDLKIDLRGKNAGDAIMCDFTNSGSDVAGNSLRMQYSLGWPNHYFTTAGAFTSSAQIAYDGDGYAPYNLYALPFRPLDGSLDWSMQMGYGKFGNPFFTIVGDNPTLTFDVAPQVDSVTLDCGRGDGKAAVTFAYASDALKTMSSFSNLVVRENVTLTVPAGVSIAGSLTLDRKAAFVVNSDGMALANRDVVFTAAEGITLPAGAAIGDVATIAGGALELSADGTQLIFLEDSTVPVTATWTGLGDRADVLDPLNWQCLNANGIVLDGAVPTEDTAITISGETSFNLPTNQVSRLQYRSLAIDSCSLTADCDWRGFGASIPYSGTPTIDLKEHKLYVSDVASAVVVTDSLSGEPGEYHIDIAAYAVLTGPRLQGNARLVKDGAAELEINCDVTPAHAGGTEICSGRISSKLNATQKHQFGPNNSEIIIRSGGTLYPYDNEQWLTLYPIVMDGGSIYTWWAGTANGIIIGSMRLLADSSLDVYSGGRMRIWSGHIVTLNGHTLSLIGAGEKCLSQGGAKLTFTEGVVSLQDGTMAVAGVIYATNTTFDISGKLNMGNTLNASNYVARYTGNANSGTGALNVYGTFKPVGAGFYGPTMQDGSTVDLSEWKTDAEATSRFPLESSYANKKTMSFAAGATVTIDLSGIPAADVKTLALNTTCLTAWTGKPDAAFRLDDETAARGYELRLDDDGLKLTPTRGFIIHVAEKDVTVPGAWVAKNYADFGDVGESAIATWLGETGANGLPRWQSWLLGLDPANASSVVLCVPGQVNTAEGEFAVGANIDVQAGSGAAVTAYLDTSADGKTWAEKVASQALTDGGTVSFNQSLASGTQFGFYRIRLAVQ